MNCQRCTGLLVEDWDVETRTRFLRCMGCSHRPYHVTMRADGLPVGAPFLCVECRTRPRTVVRNKTSKSDTELNVCEVCRTRINLANYYRWRKRRNRKRKVAA